MLIHIDLFSGIGGFALAAQWAGFKTVCFVEIDDYAQEILKQNFGAMADTESKSGWSQRDNFANGDGWRSGNEFGSPCIIRDIRTFNGTAYRGATLLTGGFPCQPFSQAGKRRGKEDDRALWPEMFRVIRESKPYWILAENVAGIINMELDNVLSDLEGEGYATGTFIIPACAVDARHRRDRVWIVAHAREQSTGREIRGSNQCDVADAYKSRLSRSVFTRANSQWETPITGESRHDPHNEFDGQNWWLPEPDVGRVAHGIPARVDRLKGLGNAIVPQVAYEILKAIAQIEQIDWLESLGYGADDLAS